jgi:hypothetical protein
MMAVRWLPWHRRQRRMRSSRASPSLPANVRNVANTSAERGLTPHALRVNVSNPVYLSPHRKVLVTSHFHKRASVYYSCHEHMMRAVSRSCSLCLFVRSGHFSFAVRGHAFGTHGPRIAPHRTPPHTGVSFWSSCTFLPCLHNRSDTSRRSFSLSACGQAGTTVLASAHEPPTT